MSARLLESASFEPFPVGASPENFRILAADIRLVLDLTKRYLAAAVDECRPHDVYGIMADAGLASAIAQLDDIAGDIAGSMERVSDRMEDDLYDGCPRGPMHRRRP